MTYQQAREAFERVASMDPRCAMAHWGIAMSLFQPLWPNRPSADQLRQGREAVQQATRLEPGTERERLYVAAAGGFFLEREGSDYWTRIDRWASGQEQLYQAYPDDLDAAALYALALLATAPATGGGLDQHQRAAEVLLRTHQRQPFHPGAIHYLIHANDVAGRERESLQIVRSYAEIAPHNPHALHMPTHIFVRLGSWQEVIDWNQRAAQAALDHPAGAAGDLVSDEYPHTLEYLIYAALQQGDDALAAEAWDRLRRSSDLQPTFKTAFHLASIPARYTLERRAWAEAASLPQRSPDRVRWDLYPWPEAITSFARGLGSARLGDSVGARRAVARITELRERAQSSGEALFARQIEILRLEVAGWLAHLEGRSEQAVELLQAATTLEATTPKSPVMPAPILPAPELLGDLLREIGRPDAAVEAYEESLAATPGRFNGMLGAALAARSAADDERVMTYCRRLLEQTAPGSPRAGALEVCRAAGGEWGTVHFPISCRPDVQGAFDRAVAALHSFEFASSARAFEAVAAADPACGMAYWGLAASEARVVWGPAWIDFERGDEAIRRAVELGAGTPRERDYIEALAVLFDESRGLDYAARVRRYAGAAAEVGRRYPEDTEAALFHGLALLGTIDAMDPAHSVQRKAGGIFEAVFEKQPNHPGAAHYLIHSYDYPVLAHQALPAARRYAKVAPAAAHALHMPSHIFSRLGLWAESIETNLASKAAAERSGGWTEVGHTLDYLIYAHLQLADDAVVDRLVEELATLAARHPDEYGVLEHLADVRARLLLERQDWPAYETLDLDPGLGRYPRFEATVRFARALGAARSGHTSEARRETAKLAVLHRRLLAADEHYYATSVAIWQEVAEAWIALAAGDTDEALQRMQAGIELDNETAYLGGFESGPDSLVHTREQLGDLLLELEQPAAALQEYEADLRVSPKRFRGLYGAARAAALSGQVATARRRYSELLETSGQANGGRFELREAETFLKGREDRQRWDEPAEASTRQR